MHPRSGLPIADCQLGWRQWGQQGFGVGDAEGLDGALAGVGDLADDEAKHRHG